jgi:hypothetical protein
MTACPKPVFGLLSSVVFFVGGQYLALLLLLGVDYLREVPDVASAGFDLGETSTEGASSSAPWTRCPCRWREQAGTTSWVTSPHLVRIDAGVPRLAVPFYGKALGRFATPEDWSLGVAEAHVAPSFEDVGVWLQCRACSARVFIFFNLVELGLLCTFEGM